ncbi:MAG: hypothetical protein R3F37_23455 [Candidatus Competibacteraceae bacterium]
MVGSEAPSAPLQSTDSDLSLPMLENIWEHLDESQSEVSSGGARHASHPATAAGVVGVATQAVAEIGAGTSEESFTETDDFTAYLHEHPRGAGRTAFNSSVANQSCGGRGCCPAGIAGHPADRLGTGRICSRCPDG